MKSKFFALALLAIVGMGSAQASVIVIGDGAQSNNGSVAIGDGASTLGGSAAVALGQNSSASGVASVAIGYEAECTNLNFPDGAGYGSCTALGRGAYNYYGGVSIGDDARSQRGGTAIGNSTRAGDMAFAGGYQSTAAAGAVAILGEATVAGTVAIRGTTDALGSAAIMGHTRGRANVIAFGDEQAGVYRQLTGVAAGTADTDAVNVRQLLDAIDGVEGGNNPFFAAQGTGNPGEEAVAGAVNTTVSGAGASGTAYGATVNGAGANVTGEAGTAAGHQAVVDGNEGTALGAYSRASDHCAALGYAAECDEYGTTSFGRDGENSRLVHVADGQDDTDAANMGQVRAVDSRVTQTQSVVSSQASWFGGGANYDPVTGVFNGPNYAFISGATYSNVGDALADLDQRVYDLEQQPPGSGPAGPQGADGRSAYEVAVDNGFPGTEQEWLASLKGDKGPEGPQGPAGQDGAGNGSTAVAGRNIEVQDNEDGSQTVSVTDQVKLSDQGSVEVGATRVDGNGVSIQGGPSMTRNGVDAGNRRVTNVADGRIEQGSQDAVNGGQIWALQQDWNDRWTEINHRVDGLEDQIDAVGAQASAMANMSGSGSYLPVGKVAINGGYGQYGSSKAFAVGAKVRFSERTSGTLGISASDDGKLMIGAGFSVTLP